MELNLNKSQFNILLQAITQVSTQVDDLRAEMKRDFMSKKDFKEEMKKYATKKDLEKFVTKDDFKKELKKELKNYPTKAELRKELKNMKDEIIEEVVSAIQPSIAVLEETAERHERALKKAGLLR